MQLLVIKLNASESIPEYALLGKKQTSDRFTPSDWKRIRSLTRGRKVLALVPSTDVVITSVNIPSKNKKQLLQAIPYSLEDSLADDIENLHFAVKQNEASNHSNVGVIKRAALEKYLDLFKENGITIHFILPETLTQFYRQDSWSILFHKDHQVNVRLGTFEAFSCEANMLEMFLTEKLEKDTPQKLYINKNKPELPESFQQLNLELIDANTIDYESTLAALPLNLLTNFSRHSHKSNINWRFWRPVFVLTGLLLGVWSGIFIWQNKLLQQQSNLLNQEMEQVYKSVFPKSRIVDPSAQLKSALDKLKASQGTVVDSPLPLISDISPLLKEYKDLNLNEISYKENELSLIIQSPSLTRLETFKRDAAEKAKLKVDIKSSTTTSNKVEATLVISPLATSTAEDQMQNSSMVEQA